MFKLFRDIIKAANTPPPGPSTPNAPIPAPREGYGVFRVDQMFQITGKGFVLTGEVLSGQIYVGATTSVYSVKGIEHMNKQMKSAKQGDMVGLLVDDPANPGDVLEFKNA